MPKEINPQARIFIAGHRGLVGSALVRECQARGFQNLILRTREELDLLKQADVADFFEREKPDLVILAAAKVGGIVANNTLRADFVYENLAIQNNVIWSAHQNDVKDLVFLGSTCIYPKLAPQPLSEKALLTGPLEETNRPYAVAKIAGLELVDALRKQYQRNYFSVMPTNLYGPNDNFDLHSSHVLPALIRKFLEAKKSEHDHVTLWGSGEPLREFLYVDDCAKAILFLIENADGFDQKSLSYANIGSGEEFRIKDLAQIIAKATGFAGAIKWDATKPDGTPRKQVDSRVLKELGWSPTVSLDEGIEKTIEWYHRSLKT